LLPLDVYENPKQGYNEIRNYFDEFLLGRPVISSIDRVQISIDPSIPGHQTWAKDVGTFEIKFKKDSSTLHARYSLDYVLDNDGIWKISHMQFTPLPHDWDKLKIPSSRPGSLYQPNDSSNKRDVQDAKGLTASYLEQLEQQIDEKQQQAEPPIIPPEYQPPPQVTEEAVRSWFDEWNAAMATGEASVVANWYSPQAVMVPIVSSTPRTTPQEIFEYYQLFLWSRPQARAIQSYVTVSKHWCKDVGVLEYTLKDSNGEIQERIKERYSFLYIYDDSAGWKIAHHHSAVISYGIQEMSERIQDDTDNRFFQ
jgi:uncharacterized protein (TIGR02246 family)